MLSFVSISFLSDVPLRTVSAEDDRPCKGEISDGLGGAASNNY
jgi:hypothetical protein